MRQSFFRKTLILWAIHENEFPVARFLPANSGRAQRPVFDLPTHKSHHTTGKNKTTDYPDEHGYEELGTRAFSARMGQGKTNTLQAGLPDFCFFSANPS
jgi:hypothetical protein